MTIYTRLGDEKGRAGALYGHAEVHRCQEDYHKAMSLYIQASEIWVGAFKRYVWLCDVG
ncbi:hypothetical protein M407DRAFT_242821 [Tulasnella calospora MUT 4182]|uniref:Uncharacterized protein n=1 Tax=Tulasnella calospora MUT 4182 TaxID=1051891 RepID=A0A0C3QD99_9AGAM|nr:hypothetical protein M407DRAFT_242821 [Tulasnella calospora MUT 4182]